MPLGRHDVPDGTAGWNWNTGRAAFGDGNLVLVAVRTQSNLSV
jgi:hypothetical protein